MSQPKARRRIGRPAPVTFSVPRSRQLRATLSSLRKRAGLTRTQLASWCGKSVEWLDLRLQQGRPLDQAGLAIIVRALREHGVKPVPHVLLEAAQPVEPLVLLHPSQVEAVARLIAAEVARAIPVPDEATLAARLLPLLDSYAAASAQIWPAIFHEVGAHDIEDAARRITEARFFGKPLPSQIPVEIAAKLATSVRETVDDSPVGPKFTLPKVETEK